MLYLTDISRADDGQIVFIKIYPMMVPFLRLGISTLTHLGRTAFSSVSVMSLPNPVMYSLHGSLGPIK